MPQLRDAKTSELLAERDDVVELVVIADKVGRDEVLFDGVGDHFDPDAVLEAHRQAADGLERAHREERDRDAKRRLQAAAKAARDALAPSPHSLREVTRNLEAARAAADV